MSPMRLTKIHLSMPLEQLAQMLVDEFFEVCLILPLLLQIDLYPKCLLSMMFVVAAYVIIKPDSFVGCFKQAKFCE